MIKTGNSDTISVMNASAVWKNFLFPRLTPRLLLRMAAVATASSLLFYFVLVPVRLKGRSMEPTLRDGSLHFIFAGSYVFSDPRPGDVVGIRLAGRRVILLKRVVAAGGETVSFRDGVLFVDGKPRAEKYPVTECDWNYPERKIGPGDFFVVGDNRSVPIEHHDFGEVPAKRIMGKLLW